MRDVIVQQIMSIDGFSCADGSPFQQMMFAISDDELSEESLADVARAGTHILGRVSYEVMASYFPHAEGENADAMNSIPKVVFSRTLERADWAETRIARGPLADEIASLKSEPGGDIVAHGGIRFTQALVEANLADLIRLYAFPIAVGQGDSIFGTLTTPSRFDVVESRHFPSGVTRQILRRRDPQLDASA